MTRDYLSARDEPALRGSGVSDPSEYAAAHLLPQEEIDAIRDSVLNEPHFGATTNPELFRDWVAARRTQTTRTGSLFLTLAAGLLAGPFAVIGAFAAGNPSVYSTVYIILFGPIIEEFLKQSGMLYFLERRPYRIFAGWQFPLAAILAALVFASIENLLYIHRFASVYTEAARLAEFSLFRWKVCTALHVSCAIIASLGLRRTWRAQVATGRPADLSLAFPLVTTAIVLHGLYNLAALFLSDLF